MCGWPWVCCGIWQRRRGKAKLQQQRGGVATSTALPLALLLCPLIRLPVKVDFCSRRSAPPSISGAGKQQPSEKYFLDQSGAKWTARSVKHKPPRPLSLQWVKVDLFCLQAVKPIIFALQGLPSYLPESFPNLLCMTCVLAVWEVSLTAILAGVKEGENVCRLEQPHPATAGEFRSNLDPRNFNLDFRVLDWLHSLCWLSFPQKMGNR